MSSRSRDMHNILPHRRHAMLATASLVFGLAAGSRLALAGEGGPKSLLISYRCDAARRPAFRDWLAGPMTAWLQSLKAVGTLSTYQILFSPFAGTATWDALLILSFARYVDTAKWMLMERTRPGGLDRQGLALATPLRTYCADLAWEGMADNPGPESGRIAYVIPYTYNVLSTYTAFVETYVLPQVRGWMVAGILSRYRIYLNRSPVGDPEPWDSLFVYDYRDLESFGRRDEVLTQVREPLKADPAWVHMGEIKSTIRVESENTQAEFLPHP